MNLKKYFNDRGMGAYLAAAFSGLSLLLTLILLQVIGFSVGERVEANIGNNLAELALQTADKLDRGMFERYREVQLLVQRPDLRSPEASLDAKRDTLNVLQETYPYYAWIGMTDMRGKVLVATQKMLEGADVSQRPWFHNALAGKYLGDVHEAVLLAKLLPNPTSEPKRFVDVAFPYNGADGKPAGVLGVHMSWRWADEVRLSIMEPVLLRHHVETFIVNAEGVVVLGPESMQGKTIAQDSFKAAQDGRRGFLTETWPDGRKYLVGYSATKGYGGYPGMGWTLLVRQKLEDANLPVARIQKQVLWTGMTLAIVFSLLGVIAARRITRPLWDLAHAAQRIEQGEAATILPYRAEYFEVRALASSLNALVGNLLQKEAALKELNLTLEQRVVQRTRELEQALAGVRASEQRIRTIIEAAQDAYVGVDFHGVITDWNTQAERMFGWRREEAIGKQLADLVIPPHYRAPYVQSMQEFQRTGRLDFLGRRLQRVVVNRKGEEFPVEMTIGLAGADDTHFFSAFLHDISERKKVERMKDEFVSTVSHELRTPLTSIRASLAMLSDGMAGELPPPAKQLLDIAYQSCERLVRLINDVLDIEKIESGKMDFEKVAQPLLPLLRQAIESVAGYAGQFDVALRLHEDAALADLQVEVDRDRMIQVLVNLLSNAVKFSPRGGAVDVRVACDGGEARVSVADHGPGVPAEFRERIFQKFAQADSTDSRQKGGTGLGLSICKNIVEEHGGRIDYRSEPGAGTEFFFELPLVEKADSA